MSAGVRYSVGRRGRQCTLTIVPGRDSRSARREVLEYRCGTRLSHQKTEAVPDGSRTTLHFVPDSSILTVTTISPAILTSYLRRLAFFTPGCDSRIRPARKRMNSTPSGGSSIYLRVSRLRTSSSMSRFTSSWKKAPRNWKPCSPITVGRRMPSGVLSTTFAVDGGTHEQGFFDALSQLKEKLELPEAREPYQPNGVIGIMSLQYPAAVWGEQHQVCYRKSRTPRFGLQLGSRAHNGVDPKPPRYCGTVAALASIRIPDAWLIT